MQLREKDLSSSEILSLAKKITSAGIPLLVNERFDIALLSGAAGIHSTTGGLSGNLISEFAPKLIKGKSVHSFDEAIKAEIDGFDYILFGPVYRTPAKIKYGSPQGIKKLEEVCKKINIPVFAVGGIDPRRAGDCIKAGAYGVAVIRELMQTVNIKKTVNEFREVLGSL